MPARAIRVVREMWGLRFLNALLWPLMTQIFEYPTMAPDTDDIAVTDVTEENSEQTGLSGVEKKKETDILLLYYR